MLASNEDPHVIALAVPSSVSFIIKDCVSVGVPDKFVVIEVTAVLSPVNLATS